MAWGVIGRHLLHQALLHHAGEEERVAQPQEHSQRRREAQQRPRLRNAVRHQPASRRGLRHDERALPPAENRRLIPFSLSNDFKSRPSH